MGQSRNGPAWFQTEKGSFVVNVPCGVANPATPSLLELVDLLGFSSWAIRRMGFFFVGYPFLGWLKGNQKESHSFWASPTK